MKRILFLWLVLIWLAGCIIFPVTGDVSSDDLQTKLIVGVTTKSEVISMLGKPDLERESYIYYLGKQYGTGIFGIIFTFASYDASYIDVYFEFDNYEILSDIRCDGIDAAGFSIEFEGTCEPSENPK
jgi:hypothetical protein